MHGDGLARAVLPRAQSHHENLRTGSPSMAVISSPDLSPRAPPARRAARRRAPPVLSAPEFESEALKSSARLGEPAAVRRNLATAKVAVRFSPARPCTARSASPCPLIASRSPKPRRAGPPRSAVMANDFIPGAQPGPIRDRALHERHDQRSDLGSPFAQNMPHSTRMANRILKPGPASSTDDALPGRACG